MHVSSSPTTALHRCDTREHIHHVKLLTGIRAGHHYLPPSCAPATPHGCSSLRFKPVCAAPTVTHFVDALHFLGASFFCVSASFSSCIRHLGLKRRRRKIVEKHHRIHSSGSTSLRDHNCSLSVLEEYYPSRQVWISTGWEKTP